MKLAGQLMKNPITKFTPTNRTIISATNFLNFFIWYAPHKLTNGIGAKNIWRFILSTLITILNE
jgi:hypothetical protein